MHHRHHRHLAALLLTIARARLHPPQRQQQQQRGRRGDFDADLLPGGPQPGGLHDVPPGGGSQVGPNHPMFDRTFGDEDGQYPGYGDDLGGGFGNGGGSFGMPGVGGGMGMRPRCVVCVCVCLFVTNVFCTSISLSPRAFIFIVVPLSRIFTHNAKMPMYEMTGSIPTVRPVDPRNQEGEEDNSSQDVAVVWEGEEDVAVAVVVVVCLLQEDLVIPIRIT
mmetsp:Transcript_31767/g.66590  ORF Transcript_31767/g.66590 Transcript_31767/m.66590 type:complete len:220 (-) Transcript_31767:209-868(-)